MSIVNIISNIKSNPQEPTQESRNDTNGSNQQAFLIIGDSIARGTSNGVGPTPSAGTVYEYFGSVIEVGSDDLEEAVTGSQWPKFGIDYNAATGFKPVFINKAEGGSEFSPYLDNNNWSTSGTRYALAQTAAANCLAALGVTQLRAIFIVLGVNDARGTSSLTQIQLDVDSLFNRLQDNYPGTPVYMVNVGRTESAISNARIDAVRSYITSAVNGNALFKMAFDLRDYANDNPEYYGADNLHLNQTGYDALGAELASFYINSI